LPKQVTKLTEAAAIRARLDADALSSVQERQRLAVRLAELAPLTRDAVPLDEPSQPAANAPEPSQRAPDGLSAEADAAVPPPLPSTPPPLPSPSTALVVSERRTAVVSAPASGALMRLEGAPPPLPSLVMRPVAPKPRRRRGFLMGLSIAIAMGVALYAVLISST
jgi:hypothetical protein